MVLDLGVTAMGEMVVGTSPNETFTISTSSRALTWDEVSHWLGEILQLMRWRCKYDHRVWSFWG